MYPGTKECLDREKSPKLWQERLGVASMRFFLFEVGVWLDFEGNGEEGNLFKDVHAPLMTNPQ